MKLGRDDAEGAVTLVPFDPAHLSAALHLSQEAGWPHRAEDWALTLSASEGVVALAEGRVVGTALSSRFGCVATLSMILVDSAMRGRGIGRALTSAAMALAGDRELRLVATAAGAPLYDMLGFAEMGRIHQHQGHARPAVPERAVTTGGLPDIPRLADLDTAATGLARAPLLGAVAATGQVLLTEGGFALLREFGRGWVLGPIVTSDDTAARALLAEAAARCDGQFLRVDLRGGGLSDFAETLGLVGAGGGIAMRRNIRTPAPTSHALLSQALG